MLMWHIDNAIDAADVDVWHVDVSVREMRFCASTSIKDVFARALPHFDGLVLSQTNIHTFTHTHTYTTYTTYTTHTCTHTHIYTYTYTYTTHTCTHTYHCLTSMSSLIHTDTDAQTHRHMYHTTTHNTHIWTEGNWTVCIYMSVCLHACIYASACVLCQGRYVV